MSKWIINPVAALKQAAADRGEDWGPYKAALLKADERRWDHAKGLHRGSKADPRCEHCALESVQRVGESTS